MRWEMTHLRWPASLALEIMEEMASAMMSKSKGEIGSPCLRPRLLQKHGHRSPLMQIKVCPPETRLIICWIKPTWNAFLMSTSLKKDQLTGRWNWRWRLRVTSGTIEPWRRWQLQITDGATHDRGGGECHRRAQCNEARWKAFGASLAVNQRVVKKEGYEEEGSDDRTIMKFSFPPLSCPYRRRGGRSLTPLQGVVC